MGSLLQNASFASKAIGCHETSLTKLAQAIGCHETSLTKSAKPIGNTREFSCKVKNYDVYCVPGLGAVRRGDIVTQSRGS